MANTLLITATAFDDRTMLAYSVHHGHDGSLPPLHTCEATPDAWAYLTSVLPDAYRIDATRIAVIDRRPGTRATSRCAGHSLTR